MRIGAPPSVIPMKSENIMLRFCVTARLMTPAQSAMMMNAVPPNTARSATLRRRKRKRVTSAMLVTKSS